MSSASKHVTRVSDGRRMQHQQHEIYVRWKRFEALLQPVPLQSSRRVWRGAVNREDEHIAGAHGIPSVLLQSQEPSKQLTSSMGKEPVTS